MPNFALNNKIATWTGRKERLVQQPYVAFSNPLGTWQDILLLCGNVFIDETKGEYIFGCM
jgi:hypothetical protein